MPVETQNPSRLASEPLLRLAACQAYFPHGMPARTIRMYALRGVKDLRGHRIKLETVLIGGSRYTSQAACQRFLNALIDAERRAS